MKDRKNMTLAKLVQMEQKGSKKLNITLKELIQMEQGKNPINYQSGDNIQAFQPNFNLHMNRGDLFFKNNNLEEAILNYNSAFDLAKTIENKNEAVKKLNCCIEKDNFDNAYGPRKPK